MPIVGTHKIRVGYDLARYVSDMAMRGWLNTDLARAAGVSSMTVTRFMRGESQTARTAEKLARALGYSVRRYVIPAAEAVSA